MIGNELLKTAQAYLNSCLVKLFNAVFTSGIYPQIWSKGYILQYLRQNILNFHTITEELLYVIASERYAFPFK
jgi:hypothetical protein